MGRMIIKKEDIKGDIEINIDNNHFIALSPLNENENNFIVSIVDGILKINIQNCTIINSKYLQDYKLKEDYLEELQKEW